MKHAISNLLKKKLNQNLKPIAKKIGKTKFDHVLQVGHLFFIKHKNINISSLIHIFQQIQCIKRSSCY
jgi:hypothetical protein